MCIGTTEYGSVMTLNISSTPVTNAAQDEHIFFHSVGSTIKVSGLFHYLGILAYYMRQDITLLYTDVSTQSDLHVVIKH